MVNTIDAPAELKTIEPTAAKKLMGEYRRQNAAASTQALKTPTGHNLNGFFIDRKYLEAILSNPEVIGLSVNLAKHADFVGQADKVFTLI